MSLKSGLIQIFFSHIKREFLINFRSLIDVISIISFMILIITLFVLGIGPFEEKLKLVSNAIFWIGLILAIIPSLEKTLQRDYDNGWLDQAITSPTSMELILLSKSLAYWLIVIIPLLISLPLFIVLLNINLKLIPWLLVSILVGGLSISLIGIIGSALTLGAKRGNILLPILIIPLIIPILIFGVGISEAVRIDESPVGNLSGGERQGVAIARAIYNNAELIVLDEPTTALSLIETQKVFDFVDNVKKSGRSVLFIGHNIYHVYDISDRFIVLDRGEVVHQLNKNDIEGPEALMKVMKDAVSKH